MLVANRSFRKSSSGSLDTGLTNGVVALNIFIGILCLKSKGITMLRRALLALTLLATSTQSQAVETARYKAVLEVVEEVALCGTLFMWVGSASDTDIGIDLQRELDTIFYSYENRETRMMTYLTRGNSVLFEVGYGELNEDEQYSIQNKIFFSGARLAEEWRAKVAAFGLSTLDDAYRDCVRVHNLDN